MAVASQDRYGSVAITLHWLIALGVIANICVGLYFADLPRSDPDKFMLFQLHKSIGLTVLVVSLMRVGWRLVNPVPPLPASLSPTLKLVARATQFLLYVLIVVIPLSGWAVVSASPLGLPTLYFGTFVWPHIPFLADLPRATKIPLQKELQGAHVFLAWSAIVLVSLHVAGALYHQFVRRDEVFSRMLPVLGGGTRKMEEA